MRSIWSADRCPSMLIFVDPSLAFSFSWYTLPTLVLAVEESAGAVVAVFAAFPPGTACLFDFESLDFVVWVHELVFRELDPAPSSEDFLSSRVMFAKKNMGSGSRVVEWSEKKREHS